MSSIGGDIAHARSELNNARKKLDQAQALFRVWKNHLQKEQKVEGEHGITRKQGIRMILPNPWHKKASRGKMGMKSARTSPYHDSQHVEGPQDLEEMKDSTETRAYKALNEVCAVSTDKVTANLRE